MSRGYMRRRPKTAEQKDALLALNRMSERMLLCEFRFLWAVSRERLINDAEAKGIAALLRRYSASQEELPHG
jgi:hypothetical protein